MKSRHWLLLLVQLPANPSSARVSLWRKLRAGGALSVTNGAWVLPESENSRTMFEQLATAARSDKGSAAVFFSARMDKAESAALKPLEWVSALLPLTASAAFCIAFIQAKRAAPRGLRRQLALTFCALFAVGLFVIGMEEISWMQRVFDIPTPALFAENQQQEMNLHNMHSIVIGQTYKIAMFAGLVLLPFLIDAAPRNRLFELIDDFLPSRFVFALSAPWVAFNYNEWNFLASQLFVTLTLAILACYLKAAWDRRDSREAALFGMIAAFIVIAQPLLLILGDRFVRMWDASEYVEFFIALGLSFYCAETMTRLAARYRAVKP